MFRQGKVPIEPFVCIDAYNKKNYEWRVLYYTDNY